MSSPSAVIVAKAESLPGVRAGIARLEDVLNVPSHKAAPKEPFSSSMEDEDAVTEWPPEARSVLVVGLHHPDDQPRLDWWDERGSPGDLRLVELCESMAGWLRSEFWISVLPLPYHVERGGLFLKDAAALAGLGVIGRNNLLVNPEWGPRIRFRAVLLEGELDPTGLLEGFLPCDSCALLCRLACPQDAFSTGIYHRPACAEQMVADAENASPNGEMGEDGSPRRVIKYCRACELACPVGV
jgi:epoxyqueuosine reductase